MINILELFLKFWMCGGTVEIFLCSYVGIIKKNKRFVIKKSNFIFVIR